MENLAKEYRYKTNQIITKKELEKLVNDLLDVEWEVKNAMNFTIKVNLREQGWVMGWTNKKRAVGTCFGGNAKRVAMSLPYFERNDDLAHDLEQTARHEIAHALDYYDRGISDHSCYWKSLAEQVLAKPERLTSAFSTPEGRYEAFCPNCGERSISHKLPKRQIACSSCCEKYNRGRFSKDYLFKWQENPWYKLNRKQIAALNPKDEKKVEPKKEIKEKKVDPTIPQGTGKYCPKCETEHPISNFQVRNGRKDGLDYICKGCRKEVAREERKRRRERQNKNK